MKKITQTVLVSFFAVVFLLLFGCTDDDTFGTNENHRAVSIPDDGLPQRDAKIYSNVTIEDDFHDSSVVVILNLTA